MSDDFARILPSGSVTFTFESRPMSIPGDLRIPWRMALVTLAVESGRQHRSSYQRTIFLMDVLRARIRMDAFRLVLMDQSQLSKWVPRVEPASGRAISIALAFSLISATDSGSLELTSNGHSVYNKIAEIDGALSEQKSFILQFRKQLSETLIQKILRLGREAAQ